MISQAWKPYTIVYYGGEGDSYWEWDSESVPESAADDRLTFKKDGEFVLNLGENTTIYHDMNAEFAGVTVTGAEKWAYVVENGAEYIQFSEGGFPGMLADDEGINAKYEIRNVMSGKRLVFNQPILEKIIARFRNSVMSDVARRKALIDYEIDRYDECMLRHLALGYTKDMIANLRTMPFGVKSLEKRQADLIARLFPQEEQRGINVTRLVVRAIELKIIDVENLEADE